jgi:hypothetical protein
MKFFVGQVFNLLPILIGLAAGDPISALSHNARSVLGGFPCL